MLADTRMRGMEGGGLRDEVIGGTSGELLESVGPGPVEVLVFLRNSP